MNRRMFDGTSKAAHEAGNDELVITRVFDAPRELVFRVWSEIDHLQNWWGPQGLEWVYSKLDFRPGGMFHYNIGRRRASTYGASSSITIERPERIEFVNSFSDAEGSSVRAPFNPAFPMEILSVLTFTEQDGKTTIPFAAIRSTRPKKSKRRSAA